MTAPIDTSRDGLRKKWDERYTTFSLDEAGCLGAGAGLSRMIYRAKKQALRKALRIAKFGSRRAFRVLDMACGFGYFAGFYHAEYPGASYTGVDISARAIDRARETWPDDEFFAADVVSWRYPAQARFDVIQAIDVLQLLTDDAAFDDAVRTLAAHLDDDGVMLVPLMFSDRPSPASHHRIRPRAYFDALLDTLGLVVTDEVRMYFWLVDGGLRSRLLRAIFARTGPHSLYLVDRLALMLGLENRDPESVLSRARMLIIRRAPGRDASGLRNTASGN